MSAAIKIGDPVRSVATHHLGRVVEIGKYDDGATRLHVDYTTGASVSCPVDAVEPLPARPFQVGDRVRVTKHHLDGDVAEVGVVRDFQRILPDVPITMWVTLDEPKPARYKPDTTLYLSCAWVTDDHTAAHALGTDTIELIEPAPTDTSGDAVTAPTPAPSDATTHVLDRIPGEPNPLDPEPVYGFDAGVNDEDGHWYARPTLWITAEHFRDLGEPQQITVTITAGAR